MVIDKTASLCGHTLPCCLVRMIAEFMPIYDPDIEIVYPGDSLPYPKQTKQELDDELDEYIEEAEEKT